MNSKNSKTSDPRRLLLNLTDKINLKRNDKYVTLSNLSMYMEKHKKNKTYNNNKFKISPVKWNEESELPYRSFHILNIQDYFEHILKKHGEKTINPSIRIYINKIKNRIAFKIKTRYYIELLTPETMNLPGSTKSKIRVDENGENVPYLEITEVVLVHCNIVNNTYQENSRVLYTFVPNRSFGQLLAISPKNLYL